MNLKIFRSNKGDCLLISSNDGKHILVDGGMKSSYKDHVAAALSNLPQLDLVCVSHIDQDHILGILALLDEVIAWRIFEVYTTNPSLGRKPKEPSFPKPPEIKEIWHNAFSAQVQDEEGNIENLVNTMAAISTSIGLEEEDHEEGRQFATSISQAIRLSHRLDPKQLNIAHNQPSQGKLLMLENKTDSIDIGELSIKIIGPSPNIMDKLKLQWDKWVDEHQSTVKKLIEKAQKDAEKLGQSFPGILELLLNKKTKIGDRNKVTTPNLASIMFYVEENGKTLLMTGDGHSDDIIAGLEIQEIKEKDKGLHVDLLKVQHHGSEYNLNADFCKQITADHYVFCGNGGHHNPDLAILEIIYNSRLGRAEELSDNVQVDWPFKFWFTGNDKFKEAGKSSIKHMKAVRKQMIDFHKKAPNSFSYEFMPKDEHYLEINFEKAASAPLNNNLVNAFGKIYSFLSSSSVLGYFKFRRKA